MNRVKLSVLLLGLLLILTACGGDRAVMTVSGEDISYDIYRYFYLNYKAEDPDYSEEELKKKCLDALLSDTSVTLMAEKYGVELTKDDDDAYDGYLEGVIAEYGSKDAYKKSLEENYLTEELFKHFYMQQILEQALRNYLYAEPNNIIKSDDATFEKDLDENFMAAKQIFIRNDEGDSIEENRALAETLLERALGGEDFSALVKEYSEDSSADADYVYHFTYGQMLSAFEKATLDTEVGDICDYVAESEAGFHIVMRMPLDKEFVDENFEDLRDAYKARCFNEMQSDFIDGLEVVYADDFEELTFE